MAEEIIQRMGFDTGDSITNLNALKTALDNMNTSIATVAASLRDYNAAGSGFNKSVADMSGKIDSLLAKFNSLGTTQAPSLKVDTTEALKQIQALTQEWGRVPKGQAAVDFGAAKAALADYVTTNKVSAQELTKAFAGVQPVPPGTASAVNQLKQSYASLVPPAQQAGSAIGGFVSKVAQIAPLRLFFSAMNEITQSFSEGLKAAQDFTFKLAQIQGIMDDTSLNMGQVREAILSTSKAFGTPIDQTAQAFYQTMQNQVGTAAESLVVFREAAQLATANNVPLGDSIDVITAAIKGWNLNINESKHLSDVFFNAIKIGRFEASDLANTLGRIGPTAHAMGISLEEAMAAVAVMTQQGVGADTAITQLNAVMTALIKPTSELKKVMQEKWGVDNAEQAILKFGGLLPLLNELEKITGGTSNEMAKLTANVRAIRGEMGLAGDNAELAAKAFNDLKNGSEGVAEAAAKLNLESEGGKTKKALNELALAWENLGEKMLPVKTILAQVAKLLIDFATGPVGAIVALSAVVGGLVFAFNAYSAAAVGATAATLKLAAAFLLTPAGIAVMATLAIATALAWSGAFEDVNEKHRQMTEQIKARAAELSKKEIEEIAKRTRAEKDALDQRAGATIDALSRARVLLRGETEAVINENAAIVALTKDRFNKILDAEKNYIQSLINSEAEGQKKIAEIRTKNTKLSQEIADKEFDVSISRFDDQQKAWKEQQRALDLLSQAKTETSRNLTNPEDVARIEDLLSRAAEFNQRAISDAKSNGAGISEINRLQTVGIDIMKQRQALGEAEIRTIEKQTKANADKALQEQVSVEKLAELFKIIEEGNNRKTKEGVEKTTQQWKEGQEKVSKAWEEVFVLMKNKVPQISDMMGVNNLNNQIVAQLNALQGFKIQVTAQLKQEDQRLTAPAANLNPFQNQAAKDLNLNTSDLFGSAAQKTKELNDELKKIDDKLATTDGNFVTFHKTLEAAFEQLPSGDALISMLNKTAVNTGGPAISEAFLKIADSAKSLKDTTPGTDEWRQSFSRLKTELQDFDERFGKLNFAEKWASSIKPETLNPFRDMMEAAKGIFKDSEDSFQLHLKKDQLELDLEKLKTITEPVRQSMQNISEGFTNTDGKITQISDNLVGINTGPLPDMVTGLGNVVAASGNVVQAMNEIQRAAIAAAQAVAMATSADTGTQSVAQGGPIRLAQGGFAPMWKDTRPAMLTPNEFVVKDFAAAKFFPQLQAMNAGMTPNFRAAGGSVTNVGDINVSVTGGDSAKQTVRQIGKELRREILRGTIKLN